MASQLFCVGGFSGIRYAQGCTNLGFYFHRDVMVFLQELTGIILALPYFFALVGIPGARFLDKFILDAQFDDFTFPGDALTVENIEFRLLEWWCYLILDHLDACFAADYLVAFFYRA